MHEKISGGYPHAFMVNDYSYYPGSRCRHSRCSLLCRHQAPEKTGRTAVHDGGHGSNGVHAGHR